MHDFCFYRFILTFIFEIKIYEKKSLTPEKFHSFMKSFIYMLFLFEVKFSVKTGSFQIATFTRRRKNILSFKPSKSNVLSSKLELFF